MVRILLIFPVLIALLLVGSLSTAADTVNSESYLIVASDAVRSHPTWNRVVDALLEKYPQARVTTWTDSVTESLESLKSEHPRYTCFVAMPSEATREFVAEVHQLTRRIDDDPYTDTRWGILTGFDADNALRIAQQREPLVVKKVASGTDVALEMCSEGVCYDELVAQKMVVKKPGQEATVQKGPTDTTLALAETLEQDRADLFVTSGHATERDWMIGYAYRNGRFVSKAGQMYAVPTNAPEQEIVSDSAKIFMPIGNCLMGHIDGPDAMALAWMNSVGVKQMLGYTVVTWYGYGGWGVLDYFVEQPGRYSFNEAFHANQHALIHRLETGFEGVADVDVIVGTQANVQAKLTATGEELGLTVADARGLLWDRDTVAFYGDPAWRATMATMPKAFDQSLKIEADRYVFTIISNRGDDSFSPINTNGSQRGWRPIVHYLPERIKDVKIISGGELNPLITDDFILVPNPRKCDPDQTYRIEFTATTITQE